MSKLPSIQFYPGDWRKDPGVQALDYETRGIWFEILLILFESKERGKLLLNGQPMPHEALASFLGLDNQKTTKALTKLESYGVISKDENGVFYSRRMVNDERIRLIRKASGKLGGNPNLLNQISTTEDNHFPTPSKEDEVEDEKGFQGESEGKPKTEIEIQFDDVRKKYPGTHKGFKFEWDNFKKKYGKQARGIVPLLLPALAKFCRHHAERKTEKQYLPHFTTWINRQGWTEEYPEWDTKKQQEAAQAGMTEEQRLREWRRVNVT